MLGRRREKEDDYVVAVEAPEAKIVTPQDGIILEELDQLSRICSYLA